MSLLRVLNLHNMFLSSPLSNLRVRPGLTPYNGKYTADEALYDDFDADQWGISGNFSLDDFTDDDDDDQYINSVRTMHLLTIRIMYTHRTTDFVSDIDGGADTTVLGIGWRFIEYYANRTVSIVVFDETESRKYGCKLGTTASVMTDVTGT
jgi:hypothetical protein